MKLSTIGLSITSLSLLFLASCANYERMCMNAGGTMEKMNVATCPTYGDDNSNFGGGADTERALALSTAFADGKGYNQFNFFDKDDVLTTLLKQPSTGKLIAVGATKAMNGTTEEKKISIIRVDATTGQYDATFAASGNAQQDGRAVYSASLYYTPVVANDPTSGAPDGVTAVINSSGRIIVASTHVLSTADSNISVMSFAADGTLAWGGQQIAAPDMANGCYINCGYGASIPTVASHEYVRAMVVDKQNRVLILAETDASGGEKRVALLRLNADSQSQDYSFAPDSSYGGNQDTLGGFTIIKPLNSPGNVIPRAIALDSSNRILIAGSRKLNGASHSDMFIMRLSENGVYDTTFTPPNLDMGYLKDEEALAIAVDSNNKILLSGWAKNQANTQKDLAMVRLDSTGALDTTFGTSGKKRYVMTGDAQINSVALQGSKIVAFGQVMTTTPYTYQMMVTRFSTDGSLDTTWGTNGEYRFVNAPDGSNKNAFGRASLWDGSAWYFGGEADTGENTKKDFLIGKMM